MTWREIHLAYLYTSRRRDKSASYSLLPNIFFEGNDTIQHHLVLSGIRIHGLVNVSVMKIPVTCLDSQSMQYAGPGIGHFLDHAFLSLLLLQAMALSDEPPRSQVQ
jgi:hypothetical protein